MYLYAQSRYTTSYTVHVPVTYRLLDAVSLDHDILRLQRRRRGVRLLLHDHLHGRLHGVLGAAGGGKQASLLLQEGPAKSTSRYAIYRYDTIRVRKF